MRSRKYIEDSIASIRAVLRAILAGQQVMVQGNGARHVESSVQAPSYKRTYMLHTARLPSGKPYIPAFAYPSTHIRTAPASATADCSCVLLPALSCLSFMLLDVAGCRGLLLRLRCSDLALRHLDYAVSTAPSSADCHSACLALAFGRTRGAQRELTRVFMPAGHQLLPPWPCSSFARARSFPAGAAKPAVVAAAMHLVREICKSRMHFFAVCCAMRCCLTLEETHTTSFAARQVLCLQPMAPRREVMLTPQKPRAGELSIPRTNSADRAAKARAGPSMLDIPIHSARSTPGRPLCNRHPLTPSPLRGTPRPDAVELAEMLRRETAQRPTKRGAPGEA